MLDELKELGFLYATKAGISIGVDDMVIPATQGGDRRQARARRCSRSSASVSTAPSPHGERHNKIIDIWHRATEKVSDEMFTRDAGDRAASAASSTRSS